VTNTVQGLEARGEKELSLEIYIYIYIYIRMRLTPNRG